jgi:hypothetical protein
MRFRIGPDLVEYGKLNVLAGRAFDFFRIVPALQCIQYPHMPYMHHKFRNVTEPGSTEQTGSFIVNSRCLQSYNILICAAVVLYILQCAF